MNDSLLPCPFCGAEVEIYEACEYMSDVCNYYIHCDNCNGSWLIGNKWTGYTESTLIDNWNRRERPHACWDNTRIAFFLTCPLCGCSVWDNAREVFEGENGKLNFCPNCGADMRQKDDSSD